MSAPDLTTREALAEAARQAYAAGFRDGVAQRVPPELAERWQAIADVFLPPELFLPASSAPSVENQVGNQEEL